MTSHSSSRPYSSTNISSISTPRSRASVNSSSARIFQVDSISSSRSLKIRSNVSAGFGPRCFPGGYRSSRASWISVPNLRAGASRTGLRCSTYPFDHIQRQRLKFDRSEVRICRSGRTRAGGCDAFAGFFVVAFFGFLAARFLAAGFLGLAIVSPPVVSSSELHSPRREPG